MGFDTFIATAVDDPGIVTLYGSAMADPPHPDVRLVPLVDPVPVYPWWLLWRRRLPESRLFPLLAATAPTLAEDVARACDPDQVWVPTRDRALLRASLPAG